MPFDELVPELAAWVEAAGEAAEVRQALVTRFEVAGGEQEEFAPVGARVERREGGFERRKDTFDGAEVVLPREVETDGVAAIGGAHPEIVGSCSADFSRPEVRTEGRCEFANGAECIDRDR